MYTPTLVPNTAAELPDYLDKEVRAIALAFSSKQPYAFLQTLNAAPTKPQEGMIVKADGTNWNPGSGAGVYVYQAGAWVFFGGSTAIVQQVVNGRLTLQSGVPTPTSELIGKTNIYFTPFRGNVITLWSGTAWTAYTFTEITQALGTLTNATNYDVYAHQTAGVVSLEMNAWRDSGQVIIGATNASPIVITCNGHQMLNGDPVYVSSVFGNTAANGEWVVANKTLNTVELVGSTGNGTYATSGLLQGRISGDQPTLQDGRYCKSSDKTRLYLGSFRTTSATTTEDSAGGTTTQVGGKRYVWNYYNRLSTALGVIDTTANWSYTTNTVRQANGVAGNLVQFLIGVGETTIQADAYGVNYLVSTSASSSVGVGYDSTTAYTGLVQGAIDGNAGGSYTTPAGHHRLQPTPGYHFVSWLEKGNGPGTCVFLGNNGGDGQQTGLYVTLEA